MTDLFHKALLTSAAIYMVGYPAIKVLAMAIMGTLR